MTVLISKLDEEPAGKSAEELLRIEKNLEESRDSAFICTSLYYKKSICPAYCISTANASVFRPALMAQMTNDQWICAGRSPRRPCRLEDIHPPAYWIVLLSPGDQQFLNFSRLSTLSTLRSLLIALRDKGDCENSLQTANF
jgi:hypothetical protein